MLHSFSPVHKWCCIPLRTTLLDSLFAFSMARSFGAYMAWHEVVPAVAPGSYHTVLLSDSSPVAHLLRAAEIQSSRRGWLTPILSPHRAYHSVHGASNTSSLNRLIRRGEFKESRACESFVCYASCHGSRVRHKPISSAAVGGHMCVVFRHTELHEVLEFGLRFLPLLPDVCTDSVPQPFVPFPHFRL